MKIPFSTCNFHGKEVETKKKNPSSSTMFGENT